MLVRTTVAAAALLAGLTTVASAQYYPPYYGGAGYYPMAMGPFGFMPSPMAFYGPGYGAYGYAPMRMRMREVAGPPSRASYAYAPGAFGWGGGYGIGRPTGNFQALWEAPAAAAPAASGPARRARAAATERAPAASARAAYAYQPGPMYGPLPQAAYRPTGTFQALWEAPAQPAPRGSRVLP